MEEQLNVNEQAFEEESLAVIAEQSDGMTLPLEERGRGLYYAMSVIFVAAIAGLAYFAIKLMYMIGLEAALGYGFAVVREEANRYMYPVCFAIIGLAIAAIVALIVAIKDSVKRMARRRALMDQQLAPEGFDRVFNEFQLVFFAVGAALMVPAALFIWNWIAGGIWADGYLADIIGNDPNVKELIHEARRIDFYFYHPVLDYFPRHVMLVLGLLLAAAGAAVCLVVINSYARKIAARQFGERFLIAKLCVLLYKVVRVVAIYAWKFISAVAVALWKFLRIVFSAIGKGLRAVGRFIQGVWHRIQDTFYKGGLTLVKTIFLMLAAVGVSAVLGVLIGQGFRPQSFLAFIIILSAMIIIFVPRIFRRYADVRTGIEHVRNGDFDYKIPTDGRGEFGRTATLVNEIAGANKLAIQKELKTERLKTDLISNVSHDLRTPLTSMISYIDLLKAEGLDSENAPEYLQILDEKTQRLKHLTDDLFEAAKASSGDIPVNLEMIDMKNILTQATAELEEVLEDKGIDLIVTNKATSTFIKADGRLLWRVMENLITNIGKHALPGSRAYADLRNENGKVILELKNISAEQLNINSDELMERFKRGDDSRNTEGSGLGLAIARDLTTIMGGTFDIVIDGDLFKAIVSFPEV